MIDEKRLLLLCPTIFTGAHFTVLLLIALMLKIFVWASVVF